MYEREIIAVQLALHLSEWVHRRRFTLQFVDDGTIRMRMTVDFTLPSESRLWAALPDRGPLLVPLHILDNVPLTGVDLHDEEKRPLSLLTSAEAAEVAVAGFTALIAPLAKRDGAGLADSEVSATVGAIVRPGAPGKAAALAKASDGKDPFGRALAANTALRALLCDLANSTLTLVALDYEAGRRRVVKIAWDSTFYWARRVDRGAAEPGVPPESEESRRFWSALAVLGWADKPLAIGPFPIGWARSTHVEIVAPDEVDLVDAALTCSQHVPGSGRKRRTIASECKGQRRHTIGVEPRLTDDPAAERSKAYVELLQARGDMATMKARVRTPLSSVIFAAIIVSAITTVLLWLLPGSLHRLDGEGGAAVLLVPPALVAAYLARPGEHAIATRLLIGVRVSALIVALCSMASAATIALSTRTVMRDGIRQPHPGTQDRLEAIAWIAAICTAAIALILIVRAGRWFLGWVADGTRYAKPLAVTAEGVTIFP